MKKDEHTLMCDEMVRVLLPKHIYDPQHREPTWLEKRLKEEDVVDLDPDDKAYPLMTEQEIWDDVSTPIDIDNDTRRFPPQQ